MLFTVFIAV